MIAPVMASKPVANTITSTSNVRLSVVMPEAVICLDRLLPQIHQRDVGPVVGGVVVGIEAGTLGAERMVDAGSAPPPSRDPSRRRGSSRGSARRSARCRRRRRPGRPKAGSGCGRDRRRPTPSRSARGARHRSIASSPPSAADTARRPATSAPARGRRRGRFRSRPRDPPAADHCGRAGQSSACAGTRSDAPPARRSAGSTGCPTIPCR